MLVLTDDPSATLWTGQPYGAEGGLIGTAAFIAGFLPNIQLAPISTPAALLITPSTPTADSTRR